MPPPHRRLIGLLLTIALLLAACGTAPAPDQPTPDGLETTYDVTYTDETRVIEASEAAPQHVSTSDDGRTFRFRPTDSLRALEPGNVAIFGGIGFGRVSAVRDEGGELVIETSEATLGEAIEDGEIGWTLPIRWDQLPAASYREAGEAIATAFAEQADGDIVLAMAVDEPAREPEITLAENGLTEGLTYSGKVVGFDVTVSLSPTAERLNIDLKASHALPGGTKVEATVTGWVSGFTQETFLKYEDSTPTQLTSEALGVESELLLEWHAAKLGEALTEVSSFKLPVSFPIPFLVGPIPVVIKVGANLQVVPELSVPDASSGGSYRVKYRSDQGLEVAGSSSSALGKLIESEIGVAGETVSAGWGVVAFALGVEFPRMELSFFGTVSVFITLKTYSTSQFTQGTTLSSDIPPCQMGTTSLAAYAGYALKLLGFTLGEKTEELWKTEYEKFKDDRPCSLTGE